MNRKAAVILSVLCIAMSCCFGFSSPAIASGKKESPSVPSETEVLSARFLNMLNHNFVYGADFESADFIVNDSVFSLLPSREGDYIPCDALSSFVSDMYGVEITDMSSLNSGYPQKPGYLYIVPCGFTSYEHSCPETVLNEDGTYTVTTKVKVQPHDGAEYTATAVSLFARNSSSGFGFNIICSDIIEDSENKAA